MEGIKKLRRWTGRYWWEAWGHRINEHNQQGKTEQEKGRGSMRGWMSDRERGELHHAHFKYPGSHEELSRGRRAETETPEKLLNIPKKNTAEKRQFLKLGKE